MEKKPRHCKDSNKYLSTSANSPPSLSAFVLKTKKMCPCLCACVQPPKGLQPSHSLSGQHYSGVLYAGYPAAQFLLSLLKATRLVGFLRQSLTAQVVIFPWPPECWHYKVCHHPRLKGTSKGTYSHSHPCRWKPDPERPKGLVVLRCRSCDRSFRSLCIVKGTAILSPI